MPRRWIPLHEDVKVPVVKNVIYAMKILFKADKTLVPAAIIAQVSTQVFTMFFQGVFFLKVLMNIIQGNMTFEYFLKVLLLFLGVGLIYEIIIIASDYAQNIALKRVFKGLNGLIFEKACEVDVSCYEDPAFYDAY